MNITKNTNFGCGRRQSISTKQHASVTGVLEFIDKCVKFDLKFACNTMNILKQVLELQYKQLEKFYASITCLNNNFIFI